MFFNLFSLKWKYNYIYNKGVEIKLDAEVIKYLFLVIWSIIIVTFLILEIITNSFIFIEFSIGAYVALICNILTENYYGRLYIAER